MCPVPATERLGERRGLHGVWLVIGVIERDGGTLYCTVLFFFARGTLAGKHRKLMPTAMERLIWGFGDGSTLPVIETGFGRMGAVICWENYMPLLRDGDVRQGHPAVLRAHGGRSRNVAGDHAAHRAGGPLFRASACQWSASEIDPRRQRDRGAAGQGAGRPLLRRRMHSDGGHRLGEIAEGKFDLDVVGHYARPDVFRLEVNERGVEEKTYVPETDLAGA